MLIFKGKNKFISIPIKIFIIGIFFLGGFFVFTRSVSAVEYNMHCENCGGSASGNCKNIELSEYEYTSNKSATAVAACRAVCGTFFDTPADGLCPGSLAYACDNCFKPDGSCAIVYEFNEISARQTCRNRVSSCATSFLREDSITISPGVCSIKKFIYQASENGEPCACREVEATDLAGAQEALDNLPPTIASCGDSSVRLEIEKIGECPPTATASAGLDYHCFRIDDNACMPIKAQDNVSAQDQAINFCKSVVASTVEQPRAELGPCPSAPSAGLSIPSGKSAKDLLAEAARELNPAHINQPTDLIGKAIKVLMAFMGSISLVLYVYAGILWLSASGASERVDKAKKVIVWTTLGVVVMLGSYMLVSFVFESLGL